jgi:hypothetical protein
MNFGFSGPMKERRVDAVKLRDENEVIEHREKEPSEFLGN